MDRVLMINVNRDTTGYIILGGENGISAFRPPRSVHEGGAVDPYFIMVANPLPASMRNFSTLVAQGQLRVREAIIVYGDNNVVAPRLRRGEVVLFRTSPLYATGIHLVAVGPIVFMEDAAYLADMGDAAAQVIAYSLRDSLREEEGLSDQVAMEAARAALDPSGPGYHVENRYGTIIVIWARRLLVIRTEDLGRAIGVEDRSRIPGMLRHPLPLNAQRLARLVAYSKHSLA